MIKKLIITLLLFIGLFTGVLAADDGKKNGDYSLGDMKNSLGGAMQSIADELNKEEIKLKNAEANIKRLEALSTKTSEEQDQLKKYKDTKTISESNINNYKEELKKKSVEYQKAKEEYDNSAESENDFSSRGFKLNVGDVFPETKYNGETNINRRANIFFVDIIQKLMIGLGSLALLLMTIGAGFMILYHGEDSMLTKGKSIFSAGIISLIVALLSFYMVELVKYLIG